MNAEENQHPINFVARVTGLSTHAIRMWERRYGVVKPMRTDSGHRRYSDNDVDRLRLLRQAVQLNHPIGEIGAYSNDALRALILSAESGSAEQIARAVPANGTAKELLTQCEQAVLALDRPRLDQTLVLGGITFTATDLIEHVVHPLMVWVGDMWHAGTLRIAHEHLATAAVRAFLEQVRRPIRSSGRGDQRIIITTLAGDHHEIGALCLSIVAAEEGWQDCFLGADMPIAEITRAAADTKSNAIALSMVMRENDQTLFDQLMLLRKQIPASVAIIVGGAGVAPIQEKVKQAGLTYAATISAFRECLRGLTPSRKVPNPA